MVRYPDYERIDRANQTDQDYERQRQIAEQKWDDMFTNIKVFLKENLREIAFKDALPGSLMYLLYRDSPYDEIKKKIVEDGCVNLDTNTNLASYLANCLNVRNKEAEDFGLLNRNKDAAENVIDLIIRKMTPLQRTNMLVEIFTNFVPPLQDAHFTILAKLFRYGFTIDIDNIIQLYKHYSHNPEIIRIFEMLIKHDKDTRHTYVKNTLGNDVGNIVTEYMGFNRSSKHKSRKSSKRKSRKGSKRKSRKGSKRNSRKGSKRK